MVRYHHRNEYFKYQPKSTYKNWANTLLDKIADFKNCGLFTSLRNSENKIIENLLIFATIMIFIGFIVVSIYKLLNDDTKPLERVRNTVKRSSNCIFDILNAFWTIKEIHVTNLQLEDDNEKFLKTVQDNLKALEDNTDSIQADNNCCIEDYSYRDSNVNLGNMIPIPSPSNIITTPSFNKNSSLTNSITKNSSSINNIKNGSKISVTNKNNDKKLKYNHSNSVNSIEDEPLFQNITFQLDSIHSKNAERLKLVKLFDPQEGEQTFSNSEGINPSNNMHNNSSNNLIMNKRNTDNRNVKFNCNNNYNDDPIIMKPIKKNQPTVIITPPPSTPTPGTSTATLKSGIFLGKSKDEVFRSNKAFDKRLHSKKGDVVSKKSHNSVIENKGIFASRKIN